IQKYLSCSLLTFELEGIHHALWKSSTHSASNKRADDHNVCSYVPESDCSSYWSQHENHSPHEGIVVEDRCSPARSDPEGRPRKLNSLDLAFLEGCIEHTPDIYILELWQELEEACGITVHETTIV
ncbi:hypothetical protein PAXRUDRAFT_607103, partial [Paxillus rubicundulus Ve08.2h10]